MFNFPGELCRSGLKNGVPVHRSGVFRFPGEYKEEIKSRNVGNEKKMFNCRGAQIAGDKCIWF